MKPEEVLYSLEHVGEDLLGAAEQNVVVRTHRPWPGIAAAAVLALAFIGGSIGLLMHSSYSKVGSDPGANGATTQSAPTEPPHDAQPVPVDQGNGTYQIAGPAGNVDAVQYMGRTCIDPVWADVDADGQTELIYWCSGPTSGLFTAGLCVYGLKEGWPVLKAEQIYCLTWGDIALTESDGKVLLHYTRYQSDALHGKIVPQTPQSIPVTVENGKVRLGSGELPEGIELYGGREYGWFGSSFDDLKSEVQDACTLNHWAALVWTEPAAASAPTAGPNVYAAVTNNSQTVTGLLHYVPQQDGTWFCIMRGIEPIETPKDPDALVGLTLEEVAARLGPCHFDMGSGMYIPCWFTKDCRMLVIHMLDTINFVELTDLCTDRVYTVDNYRQAACFTQKTEGDRTWFTDGQTEIWEENGAIYRKNSASGQTETLFTLEAGSESETALVGVTENRLYFGQRMDPDYGYMDVYSVDYHNRNQTDFSVQRGVRCEDGWIIMENGGLDASPFALCVIDRSDRIIVNLQYTWGGAAVDGCFYYIYPEALQDWDAVAALSDEERDELFQHMQYSVCRINQDSSITRIGTIERLYYAAYFQIDPEAREIKCSVEPDGERLDLFTLNPKQKP